MSDTACPKCGERTPWSEVLQTGRCFACEANERGAALTESKAHVARLEESLRAYMAKLETTLQAKERAEAERDELRARLSYATRALEQIGVECDYPSVVAGDALAKIKAIS